MPTSELPGVAEVFISYRPRPALLVGGFLAGPEEWTTDKPEYYEYICRVKWLGDYTWIEVDTDGESVLK